MSIIDAKEWTSRPVIDLPVRWLQNVQDNRDSIFIVSPYETLISISCIGSDYPVTLEWVLSWLVIRNDDLVGWLQLHSILSIDLQHSLRCVSHSLLWLTYIRGLLFLALSCSREDIVLLAYMPCWMTSELIHLNVTCVGICCWLTSWVKVTQVSCSLTTDIFQASILTLFLRSIVSTLLSWWWGYGDVQLLRLGCSIFIYFYFCRSL